jgi:hypothetical protein
MPSAKRKKMDDKTVPCRLLGYQGSTNYVLVDDDGRIFFANNVVFDEKSLLRKRIASEQPTDEPNAKRMDLTPSLPTIPLTENIRTDEEIQSAPSQSYQLNQDEPSFHVELGTPERTQSPDGAVDEHQVVAETADGHPQQRFPVRGNPRTNSIKIHSPSSTRPISPTKPVALHHDRHSPGYDRQQP